MDDPSSRKLQRIFKAAGVIGSWDWDVKADQVHADANIFELFDLACPRQSVGVPMEHIMQSIYPEDRRRVTLQRQRSMETGKRHVSDFRVQRPDGSVRMLRGRGRFLYDQRGRATRFIGLTIDLSESFDEDRTAIATQACSHPLELIADNCMAAHEISERNNYSALSQILRMAMIEVGMSLAKLGRLGRFHS
jgi:PAS fold